MQYTDSLSLKGHTSTNVLVRVVFATKNREKTLTAAIRERLHAYIAKVVNDEGGTAHVVNGGLEHIHILLRLPPRVALADLMKRVKGNSSAWLRRGLSPRFAWQTGYSAFGVSYSQYQVVHRYIASQEEHHRRIDYDDEIISMLKKNEIEFDERYLWS